MDKFEERRLDLLRLINEMGRGGRVRVASAIGKSPDYIARMLYPKDKPGYKGIGEDSVDLLDKAFPGWRPASSSAPETTNSQNAVYQVQKKTWPFKTVPPAAWESIPQATRDSLEAHIRSLVPVVQQNDKAA